MDRSITSALNQNHPCQSYLDLLLSEDEFTVQSSVSVTPTYEISMQQNESINMMTHLSEPDETPLDVFSSQSAISITPTYGVPMEQNKQRNLMTHSMEQNQNFTAHGSLVMNPQVPTYHQTGREQYQPMDIIDSVQENHNFTADLGSEIMNPPVPVYDHVAYEQYLNYQVILQILEQPAPQELAPQQLQNQIENAEDMMDLEMERPFLRNGKPRLRWTEALHERFLRAASELGGIHRATPRAIQRNMNVRGLTIDQIKSHLQKVRLRNRRGIFPEDFLAYGFQAHGHGDGGARQTLPGNGLNGQAVQLEAPLEQPRLLGGYEDPNYLQNQNLTIAHMENTLNNFSFRNL